MISNSSPRSPVSCNISSPHRRRHRVVRVELFIRWMSEPLRTTPCHVLQGYLHADMVNQHIVFSLVKVEGDIVPCHQGWEERICGRSGLFLEGEVNTDMLQAVKGKEVSVSDDDGAMMFSAD